MKDISEGKALNDLPLNVSQIFFFVSLFPCSGSWDQKAIKCADFCMNITKEIKI